MQQVRHDQNGERSSRLDGYGKMSLKKTKGRGVPVV